MKFLLLILTFCLGLCFSSRAQDDLPDKKGGGRLEAMKIAYFTKKLSLSTEEAQRFWPIYNKYNDEMRKVKIEGRINREEEILLEEKILDIRKKFSGEFQKALSSDKVNAFFRLEKDFSNLIKQELIERHQQNVERRRFRNN